MQPPPKKTSYYSVLQLEDEESDYDENNLSSVWVKEKSTKHKKAITINPTEGFRYSDIYLVCRIYCETCLSSSCVCLCLSVCLSVSVCVCVCLYTCTCTIYGCVHVHMFIHVCTCVYTCTCVYIHVHEVCVCINVHLCVMV